MSTEEIKAALAEETEAQEGQSIGEAVVASQNSEPSQDLAAHPDDVSAEPLAEESDNTEEIAS